MKLTSLSHEQEEKGYVSAFPTREKVPEYYDALDLLVQQFLTYLATVDGPDLWYARSLSLLSFYSRDAEHKNDRVAPVAFVKISEFNYDNLQSSPVFYNIEYPLPREARPWFPASPAAAAADAKTVPQDVIPRAKMRHGTNNRWASAWVTLMARGEEMTATQLINAIAASDTNPNRTDADWRWYICPACDLHSPHYMMQCERCHLPFPPADEMEAEGLFRKVHIPNAISAKNND